MLFSTTTKQNHSWRQIAASADLQGPHATAAMKSLKRPPLVECKMELLDMADFRL